MTEKEAKIILNEIYKAYNTDEEMGKYVIVKINHETETDNRQFEFQGMFNNEIRSIELTHNLTTLNLILKELLNNDYVINFDYEKY